MEKVNMICIICPKGCELTAEIANGKVAAVHGNTCARGLTYAQNEIENPIRTLTSSVAVKHGVHPRVSVKTDREIPKGKMMECARALKGMEVEAPVRIGDVLIENVADTGSNIIATIHIEKK